MERPGAQVQRRKTAGFSFKIRSFCERHDIDPDDPCNIFIPVYLYGDESVSKSGNRKAFPLWMTSALIDPSVRELLGVKAHELIALLPVSSGIDFRFKRSAISMITSRSQASTLVACNSSRLEKLTEKLRLQAYRTIFDKIASLEESGRDYIIDNQIMHVRIIVAGVVMDMKERRIFLGLQKNRWHCSTCYDHPGDIPSDEEKRVDCGQRQKTRI